MLRLRQRNRRRSKARPGIIARRATFSINFALLAVFLLFGLPGSLSAKTAPFPPEVVKGAGGLVPEHRMRDFAAKPLWPETERDGYRNRHRLIYYGILRYSLMIQIDEKVDGPTRLIARVLLDQKLVEHKSRNLRAEEIATFKKTTADAGLWSIHPEFWMMNDPDDICIDGMEAILEWQGEKGYRYSEGNTSCTSPPGMNRLAETMVDLAEIQTNKWWFPWAKPEVK